jgi:hypothetical protein
MALWLPSNDDLPAHQARQQQIAGRAELLVLSVKGTDLPELRTYKLGKWGKHRARWDQYMKFVEAALLYSLTPG